MSTERLCMPQVGVGAIIRGGQDEILLVLRNREPEKIILSSKPEKAINRSLASDCFFQFLHDYSRLA
ncbi:hypothetical protein [Paenibacillus periandrae]|uniref:hypothetical protein n=1 Tax=Paenibacillus periandrae TaxID=1761741 RepID=UPI001F0997BA|nr:hypothetical protein [Paenibacillus periandrae]